MGLDRDTRECQNTEKHDECKTRFHLETLRHKCGCLPLSLNLCEEVLGLNKSKRLFKFFTQDALCMTDREIGCSKINTTQNPTTCLR